MHYRNNAVVFPPPTPRVCGDLRGKWGANLTAFLVLLLHIVGQMMNISEDKYYCGWDIRTDVLSGKEKKGYFSNKSQIFKIFRYFNQIEI